MFTLTPLMQVHQLPVNVANNSAASFRFTYVETIVIAIDLEKKSALGGLTNSFRLS